MKLCIYQKITVICKRSEVGHRQFHLTTGTIQHSHASGVENNLKDCSGGPAVKKAASQRRGHALIPGPGRSTCPGAAKPVCGNY